MTRICKNCQYENKDEYDYCAKCGTPLIEGARPKQVYVYRQNGLPEINKKAVLISYILTILLSWSGFIVNLFAKNAAVMSFTFFGFFLPFYLIQSKHPTLRKHGLIQLLISLVGVTLSFYVIFH